MTAQEARQLTASTKKDINHVLKSIETMARNGYYSATFEINIFKDVEEVVLKLKELQYDVDQTLSFLTVKWS